MSPGSADAEADTEELARAQGAPNGFQPLVATGSTALLDAYLPERYVHVVVDDDEVLSVDMQHPQRRPAEVHEGLRLCQRRFHPGSLPEPQSTSTFILFTEMPHFRAM